MATDQAEQAEYRERPAVRTAAEQRALRFEFAALMCGMVLGLGALHYAFGAKAVEFEELALGKNNTVRRRASVGGHFIHCAGFETEDDRAAGRDTPEVSDCVRGVRQRGDDRVVLWLGNSQVFAINNIKPGDTTAVLPLHAGLREQDLDLVVMSYPNANLQEHYATYAYLKAHVPLRAVLVSLVFDDMREDGLRARLAPMLDDPKAAATLEQSAIGKHLLDGHSESPADGAQSGSSASLQERSESALTGWLEKHSHLWAQRQQMRGGTMSFLYHTRNAALGITPQSKRKVIPSRYADNRAALEALLKDAARSQVTVLAYIAPLRSDVEPPYVMAEYSAFREDMRALVAAHGGRLADLQDLIPARYWGTKGTTSFDGRPELDFMHFQGPGHLLIAEALREFVAREVTP